MAAVVDPEVCHVVHWNCCGMKTIVAADTVGCGSSVRVVAAADCVDKEVVQ